MIKTLATARDTSAPMVEVVPGHFVHATRQRRWAGEVADETVAAWLRDNELTEASVHVYRIAKARHETMHDRRVSL